MTGASIISLDFESHAVRAVLIDGEPWWVAADVGRLLGHSNIRRSLQALDDDEKGVTTGYTLGGPQELNVVSESGLYALCFISKLPAAKRFRKWVTSEVLPALRRDGAYSAGGDQGELAAKRAYYRALPQPHRERADLKAQVLAEVAALIAEGTPTGAAIAEVAAAQGLGDGGGGDQDEGSEAHGGPFRDKDASHAEVEMVKPSCIVAAGRVGRARGPPAGADCGRGGVSDSAAGTFAEQVHLSDLDARPVVGRHDRFRCGSADAARQGSGGYQSGSGSKVHGGPFGFGEGDRGGGQRVHSTHRTRPTRWMSSSSAPWRTSVGTRGLSDTMTRLLRSSRRVRATGRMRFT